MQFYFSVLNNRRRAPISRNLSSVSDTEQQSEAENDELTRKVIVGSKDIQANMTPTHM